MMRIFTVVFGLVFLSHSLDALASPRAAHRGTTGGRPRVVAMQPAAPAATAWETTLDRVVKSVVAIRVSAVRSFDTEDASTTVGTGFVIDAERGLILTNRHMVHAGPVVAQAVFLDHEEVPLQPIYRDPIHDFGIYRFDPKAVHYMPVTALKLVPEAARVGVEIRVVGNDAGEKISILDGTLARLDRSAPDYGRNTYNDFNTFYIQAASNTSGGSSGSPVVDIQGRVLALNAGGSRGAASSFYLPLDRVVTVVESIRSGNPVTRGTLQTVFEYLAFDEARRLGLRTESEKLLRSARADGTGALVVEELVPEGPAWGKLEPGDILLRLDGKPVVHFATFEGYLDANVGHTIQLDIERGGTPMTFALDVGNLHDITPDDYLEIGRAVLNDLSLQQARNHGLPVRGVYVASAGYWLANSGIGDGSVILEVDGVAVPTLDAFQSELEKKAHHQRVRLRAFDIKEPKASKIFVATVDRAWNPMQRCRRSDSDGTWPCVESPVPPPLPAGGDATVEIERAGGLLGRRLASAVVGIRFEIPHPTTGLKDFSFRGAGVVVDVKKGLVITDRDTVPVNLGDLTLTFGGALRVPGRVLYLHPFHNFAIVQYDPSSLGDTRVSAVHIDPRPMRASDRVWQVGVNADNRVVVQRTVIEAVKPLTFGISNAPRFRDLNVEGWTLKNPESTVGAALVDKHGALRGLWASFVDQKADDRTFYGLPAQFFADIVTEVRKGQMPMVRMLGAEFSPLSLTEARERGLTASRFVELQAHNRRERQVLEVVRRTGGTDAQQLLREGDVLLEVNGKIATFARELEALTQAEHVQLRVLRDGQEVEVGIKTLSLDGHGIGRVVQWAGAILHEPHIDIAAQQGISPEGVYLSWMWYGSPSATYGLRPTRRIVDVDGTPTPTFEAFLRAVAHQQDGQSVRIKTIALDGKAQVSSLKIDLRYWPTTIIEQVNGVWLRHPLHPTTLPATAPVGPSD